MRSSRSAMMKPRRSRSSCPRYSWVDGSREILTTNPPAATVLRSPVAGWIKVHAFQTLAPGHRLDLPSRQVLDALLGTKLSDDVVPCRQFG